MLKTIIVRNVRHQRSCWCLPPSLLIMKLKQFMKYLFEDLYLPAAQSVGFCLFPCSKYGNSHPACLPGSWNCFKQLKSSLAGLTPFDFCKYSLLQEFREMVYFSCSLKHDMVGSLVWDPESPFKASFKAVKLSKEVACCAFSLVL